MDLQVALAQILVAVGVDEENTLGPSLSYSTAAERAVACFYQFHFQLPSYSYEKRNSTCTISR